MVEVEVVHALTSIFGGLALLALVATGFVMIFSPALGRQMLKNTFTALILFVVGRILSQAACGALLHTKRAEVLVRSIR